MSIEKLMRTCGKSYFPNCKNKCPYLETCEIASHNIAMQKAYELGKRSMDLVIEILRKDKEILEQALLNKNTQCVWKLNGEQSEQILQGRIKQLEAELAELKKEKLERLNEDEVYECLADHEDYDSTFTSRAKAICERFGTDRDGGGR